MPAAPRRRPAAARAKPAAAASPHDAMAHREAAHYILNQVRATVDNVGDDEVARFIRLMRESKSVVVFGRGRSGFMGRGFVVRLLHLGVPAHFVGETVSPPVHEDDVVVLLSSSGETFSVVVTAQTAKNLGCRIVSITGNPDSTLAKLADLTILLRSPTGDRQRALAPLGTLFEAACAIFLDGVVADLMRRTGATEESMRSRHATLE